MGLRHPLVRAVKRAQTPPSHQTTLTTVHVVSCNIRYPRLATLRSSVAWFELGSRPSQTYENILLCPPSLEEMSVGFTRGRLFEAAYKSLMLIGLEVTDELCVRIQSQPQPIPQRIARQVIRARSC